MSSLKSIVVYIYYLLCKITIPFHCLNITSVSLARQILMLKGKVKKKLFIFSHALHNFANFKLALILPEKIFQTSQPALQLFRQSVLSIPSSLHFSHP